MKNYQHKLVVLLFASVFATFAVADKPAVYPDQKFNRVGEGFYYPQLVADFYKTNGDQLYWMTTDETGMKRRSLLCQLIDSAARTQLIGAAYYLQELRSAHVPTVGDSIYARQMDKLFTDAAIALCKDVFEGYKTGPWVGYDQLTIDFSPALDKQLVEQLYKAIVSGSLSQFIFSLEPVHKEYKALQTALRIHQVKNNRDTVKLLVRSMNLYRWIHHFGFEKFIIINLPEARLRYVEHDKVVLDMKTVVGKPSTPTPRFATVCDQAILYPYWYVPPSIIFNEYLPKIKSNPAWLDAHNMQIIDGKGRVMDHMNMNWSAFHRGNFPYSMRQSTGCDNALGVIKFNIITPYGVYLHDTNNKTAFLSGYRFYSHGCIRLEQPMELGNRILPQQLDTNYLQSCFRDQQPHFLKLKSPLPVFSVYMQAMPDAREVIHYFKDVYKLN
ncbi:MAG: L,D-transpeptidase family protein [Bacteroidetes bacterium]|nr:L,D-transpeptidase family protein [Bacteroidota bacterium]